MGDFRSLLRDPRAMARLQAASGLGIDYSGLNQDDPDYVPLNDQRAASLAANPNSATAQILSQMPNPPQMTGVGNADRPQDNPYPVLPPGSAHAAAQKANPGYQPPRLPNGGVDPNAVDANQMPDNRRNQEQDGKVTQESKNSLMQILGPDNYQKLVGYLGNRQAPEDFVTSRSDRDMLRQTLGNYMKYSPVQVDMSPLAGLTAAWSRDPEAGKLAAAGYQKPANMASDAAMIGKLGGDLTRADNDISSQDNNLARTVTGGMFVTAAGRADGLKASAGHQPVRSGTGGGVKPAKPIPLNELDKFNNHLQSIQDATALLGQMDQNPGNMGMGRGALAAVPFDKVPLIGTDTTQTKALKDAIERYQRDVMNEVTSGGRFSSYTGKVADSYAPSINRPYSQNKDRASQLMKMSQMSAQELLDGWKSQGYPVDAQQAALNAAFKGAPAIKAPPTGGGKPPADDHQGALDFIKNNPNDPRVPAIKAKLKAAGVKVD